VTVGAWGRHLAALSAVAVLIIGTAALREHLHTGYLRAGNGEEALVKIEWAEGVGVLERWRLERELGLTFAEPETGRWWAYHMPDANGKLLERIVVHPRIAQTRQIDRANYRPDVVVKDDAGSVVPRPLQLTNAIAWPACAALVALIVLIWSGRGGGVLRAASRWAGRLPSKRGRRGVVGRGWMARIPWRHLAALSAVVVLVAGTAAVREHLRTGYLRPSNGEEALVKIEWAEGVGLLERWRLERELGLTFAQFETGRWWAYHMPDAGGTRLERIIVHERVAQTRQIDRATYTPDVIVKHYAGSVMPRHLETTRVLAWPVCAVLVVLVVLLWSGVAAAAPRAFDQSARRFAWMPRAFNRSAGQLGSMTWRRAGWLALLLAGVLLSIAVEAHIRTAYWIGIRGEEALIRLRWTAEVGPLNRWRLERRLGLTFPASTGDRWWTYHMPDANSGLIERIVLNPAVAETGQIDRARLRPQVLVTNYAGSRLPTRWRLARAGAWLWPLFVLLLVSGAATIAGRAASAVVARRGARGRRARAAADTRIGRPAQALVLFATGLVPLTAWSLVADLRHPEWRAGTIYQRDLRPLAADEFLSQDPELIDHDVYYHGLHGWVEHARRADVIFTGNSRAVYAFRREALRPHFERLGLRYYSLAFAGGADAFPLALMRKFDIRPKILVINMHGFFANDPTRFGQWAMSRDLFGGWNFVMEREASWTVRQRLHTVMPHWPTFLVHEKETQVIYRSTTDGTWQWAMPVIQPKPMGDLPVARNPADAAENEGIARWNQIFPRYARQFIDEMTARGTAVVLVYVPWSDPVAYFTAIDTARGLGKPMIVAWPDGLMSALGSHIDEASAIRYVDALMPQLLETPEFRALRPTSASAR
jgi:hypothetical protein